MNGYCGEQHLITTGDSRHRRREDEPSSSSQLQLVANIVAKTNERFHFFTPPTLRTYSESRSSRTKHIFVQRSLWNSFCWNLLIAVCGRTGPTIVDRNFKHDALSGAVKQARPTRFSVAAQSERSRLFGVWRCLTVSAERSRADRSTWAPAAPAGLQLGPPARSPTGKEPSPADTCWHTHDILSCKRFVLWLLLAPTKRWRH